ncbi:MAG: 50S ribosomal protein L21 [bacterium]|nr:50S ribosomal protein L21 [bacterium]
MLAVIKTGGKQYLVKTGDKIKIEKIDGEVGSTVAFSEILFAGDEKEVKVGNPFIKGMKIEGNVLKQDRSKKVWGMKFKAKKRYKVKFGHRQPFTEVEITKIG